MTHPARHVQQVGSKHCRCGVMCAGYRVPPVVKGAVAVVVHFCTSCDLQPMEGS